MTMTAPHWCFLQVPDEFDLEPRQEIVERTWLMMCFGPWGRYPLNGVVHMLIAGLGLTVDEEIEREVACL